MLAGAPVGRGWRACAALGILIALVFTAMATPRVVLAHAFLERSDPAANSVLPSAPSSARLWFTEPIEPDFSDARLFDSAGNQIPTADALVTGANELTLPLPANLANGTYTIQWRNVSRTDGHPQAGYVPFTIGTQADVVEPIVPEITAFGAPPTWLSATARWLSLLGASLAVGGLAAWLWVLRPAVRALPDDPADTVRDRTYSLTIVGVVVAAVGSLFALSVQSASSGGGYGPSGMLDVAFDSRWGTWWLARVVLLLALAGALSMSRLWDDPPGVVDGAIALGIAGMSLLPYALASHAASQPTGRPAAIATDWLHLMASSVWVGGLATLLVALVYGTRGAPGADRRAAWAEAIPRFTTLALVAILVLAVTGIYAAWLQVGNLTALRETAYGQALIIKLALIVPMLALGALNQQVIGPRLRAAAVHGRRFARAVAAEAMLGVGVLFAVGILTSLAPARDELVANSGATAFHWAQDGLHAALYLSPGAAGFNRYTVDVAPDFGTLPPSTQVLLRVSAEDTVEGVREIPLPHLTGPRYEASGSEVSVVGDWTFELIVRLPDGDWRATATGRIESEPPEARLPSAPPRFNGANAAIAVLFVGLAVVAIVGGLRLRDRLRERLTVAGFGVALLLTAGVIFAVTQAPDVAASRDPAGPPVPRTAASVAAGKELFQAKCASCHGPEGKGDGPLAGTLRLPPADLTIPHVDQHSDQDLHWWIRKGVGDTMPAFEAELTDEQIWHLVNYIRSLRHPVE